MRLTVTRRTDLAIRVIRVLAARSGSMQGDELAASVGTTRGFLVQVMTPLVRARWVRSTPGPHGGYRVRGTLAGLTVLDVLEAAEGPIEGTVCVLESERDCASSRSTADGPCALHEPWLAARSALRAELGRRPVIAAGSPDH
jgi:Rrf2 family protein